MPTISRVSFGAIAQACEDKLVSDFVVDDRAQITWGTPDDIEQLSGPWDIVFVLRNGEHSPQDGGCAHFRMVRYMDVFYRSESISDPGGGKKAWLTETFQAADAIIDSIGNDQFWPEDGAQNALTVLPISLASDQAPQYPAPNGAFGKYVCTLKVDYLPDVDPTKKP